jgi:hypothetical protein
MKRMTAILTKNLLEIDNNNDLQRMVERAQIAQDELVKFSADAVHRVFVEKALKYAFEGKQIALLETDDAPDVIKNVLRSIRGLLGKDFSLSSDDIDIMLQHAQDGMITKEGIYSFTDALFQQGIISSLSSHVPASMIDAHNAAQNNMTLHLDWHQNQLNEIVSDGKTLKTGEYVKLSDEEKAIVMRHNQLVTDWRDGMIDAFPQSIEFSDIANRMEIAHPHIEGVTQHPLMTAIQGMHEAVKRLEFTRINQDLQEHKATGQAPAAHIISLFEKGIKSPASIQEKIAVLHEGNYFNSKGIPNINDAARDKIIIADVETMERLTHHSVNIIAEREDVTLKSAKLRMTGQGEWHAGMVLEFALTDKNGESFQFPTEYFFTDVKQHEIEQISHSIYNCIKLVKDSGSKQARNQTGDRDLNHITIAEAQQFIQDYNHVAAWVNARHSDDVNYFLSRHGFEDYQLNFSKEKIIDNTRHVLDVTQTPQRDYQGIIEALDELQTSAVIMNELNTQNTDILFKITSEKDGFIGSEGSALIALKAEELRSMHRFIKANAAKSHMDETYDRYNGAHPSMSALYAWLSDNNNPLKARDVVPRAEQVADMPEHIFIPELGKDFTAEHMKQAHDFVVRFDALTKPLLTEKEAGRVR